MRVLFGCSLGGQGHLDPLVPFLDAFVRRGDDVLVTGPPAMAELVRTAGYRFRAGGEPPEADVAVIREQLPVVSPAHASVLGNRELFGRMATAAMLPEVTRLFRQWRPELVIREPCEYSSAIGAARAGVPMAQVAISLAEVEAGSIEVAGPAIEEQCGGVVDAIWSAPYLSRFPGSIDPSPFPTTLRYRDREPRDSSGAPKSGWSRDSRTPLVYVSFGTVLGYMSSAAQVYRTAIAAVRSLDARVVLTVGRHFDPAVLGDVPRHVTVAPWIDQDRVLPSAALVVCHGGSGTVLDALAAGVPMVVVPVFADQFENGRRVQAAGAGLMIENPTAGEAGERRPPDSTMAPAIAAAINTVLDDPTYRTCALDVRAEIAAAPTPAEVLQSL